MNFIYHDGGREAAGYKGLASDCVTRSIAIASGRPYQEIYDDINALCRAVRSGTKGGSAREGVITQRFGFKRQMLKWGFAWTPTMGIATGCTVHLHEDELPLGRLVVAVSKHYTAVIDHVIYDTHDPQRYTGRCVYGYWRLQ